jgi:prohibitin 2
MNNGQDAFRRLAKQIQRASAGGGGGFPGGNRGLFAGSGLLVALVGGGLLLNSSLYNGALELLVYVLGCKNSPFFALP